MAVLPVVLFHVGVPYFDGGYVGVDVFFVISGYLITAHILTGLYQQDFSFRDFYARRVRRIFPVLIATVAFTLSASTLLLMPAELAETGKAAQSIAYFFSNYYFLGLKNDYWSQNSLSAQPLLHTWSLAIEEQYYLVLPCLLVLVFAGIKRLRSGLPPLWMLRGVLVALALASFWTSVALLRSNPAAAFYMLPSRAWELLMGGVVAALAGTGIVRPGRLASEACALFGLACIVWAVFSYTQATPFPALHALAPVAGASLVVYAGQAGAPTLVSRLLSARPLVFVGLISYSLYLWHWPLLVLSRSAGWSAYGLPVVPAGIFLVVVLAVSWASWRWIERPFRTRALAAAGPHWTLGAGTAAMAACLTVGLLANHLGRSGVLSARLLPESIIQLGKDIRIAPGIDCEGEPGEAAIRSGTSGCTLGGPPPSDRAPDFVLLGDSHARMWVDGLGELAREHGWHGTAMAYSSCVPLIGATPPTRADCARIMDAALAYVTTSQIQRVILAGYWTDAAATAFGDMPREDPGAQAQRFAASLRRTVAHLQRAGKDVTVVLDVPQLEDNNVPYQRTMQSLREHGAPAYGESIDQYLAHQRPVIDSIAALQRELKFAVVNPAATLCASGQCLVARDGRTWYRDKHHLTDHGGRELRATFLPAFEFEPVAGR